MQVVGVQSFPAPCARTHANQAMTRDKDLGTFVVTSKSGPTDTSSIWDDLSERCDIRNCSADELNAAASSLYKAGQISLKELAILTLRPIVSGANDGYLTASSAAGKRDWIAELGARLKQDQRLGNTLGAENKRNALAILRRLAR